MEEAYVFDMGGVIKESFDLEEFYKKLETKVEFENFKKYYEKNILVAEIGEITSDEFLDKLLKYSLSGKNLQEAKKIYEECTGNLYEDTMNIISYIKEKGKKVYLLSNLKQIDFECLKKKLDIHIFEKTFLSYELGCMKNETKIFQILINELKINPNKIYFFDDKEENIENARKKGINACQVNGKNIKEKFNKLQRDNIIKI